jgi:tRNA pseudouridine38-40 synthase
MDRRGATTAGPRHFLLAIAYDGAGFHGWQRQKDARTVQGTLEETLAGIVGQAVTIRGAGRTDAGVHAVDQKAAFTARTRLRAADVKRALNALLPDSVRVVAAEETPFPIDPRRAALRKTYVYQFHVGELLPPERRAHFAWAGRELDVEAMRKAARHLLGEHDFTSFARAEAARRGAVRRIDAVRVRRIPRGVRLFFTGSGFLYNMVRTLASALLEVGRGRREPDEIAAILQARERARAPATLPAHGLWLWRVDLDRTRARPGAARGEDEPIASAELAPPAAAG